jgi:hypothetical protein
VGHVFLVAKRSTKPRAVVDQQFDFVEPQMI